MTDKLSEYEQLARDLARDNPDSHAVRKLALDRLGYTVGVDIFRKSKRWYA